MPLPSIFSRRLHCSLLIIFGVLFLVTSAAAKNVILPLTLDHGLLTSLLVQHSFPEHGPAVSLVGRDGDCVQIKLSEPDFSTCGGGDVVCLEMKLYVRAGKQFGDKCLVPVSWQGYLQLFQEPYIVNTETGPNQTDFSLAFKTIDSKLLTEEKQPAGIAGFLWEFAKPEVYGHLDKVRIDLAPPLKDLRSFLAPLFHEEARAATSSMLDSLQPGVITVQKDRIQVALSAEVVEVFNPDTSENTQEVSVEERQQIVHLWETWDAFLVHLLSLLAAEPLQPEDRQVLVDVLLETRHNMVAALEEPAMDVDLVRVQFLYAWEHLAPVFRRQLYSQPSNNSLGYLAFFTAADALSVFDTMGPTLGIEISEQGLLRLARMLSGQAIMLPYNRELDTRLRDLFQLLPIEESSSGQKELKEIELPQENDEINNGAPLSTIFNLLVPSLYAASEPRVPEFKEILKWKVPKRNYEEYVARVRGVLSEAAEKVLAKKKVPTHLHSMFSTLIPAMAWQESCFRQFIVKKNKLTYLLSYNNSSVGVMQINERVWRGLYNRHRLRWDINYNALAGCEIVELYLKKYVLRHDEWKDPAKSGLLARVVYSMYNGGPRQYKKFLARENSGNHYQSDQLFSEKLQWALKGKWNMVRQCFLGG